MRVHYDNNLFIVINVRSDILYLFFAFDSVPAGLGRRRRMVNVGVTGDGINRPAAVRAGGYCVESSLSNILFKMCSACFCARGEDINNV